MSATLRQQLGLPKMRGHEALVIAFLIDALGTGLYLPFSLLYFQKIADLALPPIGKRTVPYDSPQIVTVFPEAVAICFPSGDQCRASTGAWW